MKQRFLVIQSSRLVTGDRLFPDYSNKIKENDIKSGDSSWTATQDCYVTSSQQTFTIDGVQVARPVSIEIGEGETSYTRSGYLFWGLVARGSVLTGSFTAYGLKPSS